MKKVKLIKRKIEELLLMMLPEELRKLIDGGENITVEFKKSIKEITKDVYESVCAFSNRDGGHIFLGVNDNGTILGIDKDFVEKITKEFVTTINNENKMYPPLYLMQYLTKKMENASFTSVCRYLKMSAAVPDVFGIGLMNPILMLPTIPMRCIAYILENAEAIL